jgi:hypothetical protein
MRYKHQSCWPNGAPQASGKGKSSVGVRELLDDGFLLHQQLKSAAMALL